jgi:hypothetical protein
MKQRAVLKAVQRLLGFRAARMEWLHAWNERRMALEKLFGHAVELGPHPFFPYELGGDAHVLAFANHIVGARLYVTTELTGTYGHELAMCVREDAPWAAPALNRLSAQMPLHPGDTIAIGAVPRSSSKASSIRGFVIDDYGSSRHCGVLLCIGVTAEELQMSSRFGSTTLLGELRGAGVYPFTDPDRDSIGGDAA